MGFGGLNKEFNRKNGALVLLVCLPKPKQKLGEKG